MTVMSRSRRLSNVLFTFLGAAAVGLVVVVLALGGVFDRTTERVVTQPGPATTTVVQPPARAGSVADIYAKTAPGVAFISATSGGSGPSPLDPQGGGGQASGSGFLIDDQGRVVTNDHVVEAGSRYTVRFGANSKALPAKLLGKDPSTDLAVLEVDPDNVPKETKPLALASSENLRPGDSAIAIGSPFGLSGTVTTGVISAPDREIGVNSQIASSSRQSSGVGFAVPADTVKDVVPQLISGGDIERAYIGVSTTQDPTTDGAVVAAITPTGPAARTDLRPGDRITALDGKAIKDPSDLSGRVLDRKPGERVELTIVRDGKQRTIDVQLGTRPDQ